MSDRARIPLACALAGPNVALPCAALLLLTLACSGPTDIVGVVEGVAPSADDELASDDATASASDVALLLAGRPMTDWPGEALQWPLSMPLGELFAAPANDGDSRARLMPAPWPSRRVASGFARGSARGNSAIDARAPEFDARLLILDEADARRLLALMTPEAGPSAERAAVFRDALRDVYRVSLESDEMPLDAAGCGDRMRRGSFECTGRGPFD